MAISRDGNSLTITDCDITFDNSFDPTTGVATITITPKGGLSTLPALAEGPPGLPPQFRNITVNQVPYGQPLPTARWDLIYPGGPGIPSVYDLELYLHQGEQGPSSGPTNVSDAPDVDGQPQNFFTLIWNDAQGAFNYVAQLVSSIFTPGPYSSSGNAFTRTLAKATVPAQQNSWVPIPYGQTVVSGTQNTVVNLFAHLNSTDGPVVGIGYGAAATNPIPTFLLPSIPGGQTGLQAATVPAGQAATIYLVATQINTASTDPWTTDESTTHFTVQTMPVFDFFGITI